MHHVHEETSRHPCGRRNVCARGRELFRVLSADALRPVRPWRGLAAVCSPVRSSVGSPVGAAVRLDGPHAGGAPAPSGDAEAAEPVVVIVHLEEGADREATLASINEAVAGVYPDATVEVEREYKNALQGYALRVPAGSLDAIRGVSGVKLVSIERETRVQ